MERGNFVHAGHGRRGKLLKHLLGLGKEPQGKRLVAC